MARTCSGTIGQLTNNGVGVAGMAFNVRIMPVKVLDGDWDFIFDAPNVGTSPLSRWPSAMPPTMAPGSST